MPSPNTFSQNSKGFTLIEILISIAILSVLLGLGLFMTMDAYRGFSFRSESATAVSALEKARSRAINNYFQTPHGVCYDSTSRSYVIFRGSSYTAGAATNDTLEGSPSATVSGFPLCRSASYVVFEQLTGKLVPQLTPATTELTITISQDARTASIHINNEGTINW